jgi:hypothetical protein
MTVLGQVRSRDLLGVFAAGPFWFRVLTTFSVTGIRTYSPVNFPGWACDLIRERDGPLLGKKVHEESILKESNGKIREPKLKDLEGIER